MGKVLSNISFLPDKNMTNSEKKSEQKKHGIIFKLFWIIVIAIAVIIGGRYSIRAIVNLFLYESTDDAFIEGHIVSISPKVSGFITQVLVNDNQDVKKGDLIVTIDARDYQARVNSSEAALLVAQAESEKAKAGIAVAKAQSDRADNDLKRYENLNDSSSISKQDLDNARAASISAKANLEVAVHNASAADARVVQAQTSLDQAKLDLSYTNIYAPQDGRIAQKHAEQGSYVTAAQPLMAIISYDVWVTANFKETQLENMHPGQNVTISVDAFDKQLLKGHIDSIQPGTGSRFSLLPSENATGNYVKVVQRIPVKIIIDEPVEKLKNLSLGMSVEPRVYTADETMEHASWLKTLEYLGGMNHISAGENK
jgi:membrane fusion protein, multidrug efflux system